MSRTDFAYAQARLHARLSGRLDEADWQRLEASRDLAHCLDAAAGTQARAYAERLDRASPPHTIERVIRDVWSGSLAELCAWLPEAWRGAVAWMQPLPHLARIEAAAKAGVLAEWLAPEREFAGAWPDLERAAERGPVPDAWLDGWLDRFAGAATRREAPVVLAPALARYLGRGVVLRAGTDGDATQDLIGVFRRRAQTPLAIFAYVLLTALEADRLRGILVNRSIFPGGA